MILLLCALLASAASAGADVYFEEEVVNRGFGKDKVGARKTTNKIYIKDKSQRVEQLIEADAKTAKALRRQGQSLNTSTILRLDQAQVYEIDLTAQTFVQQKAPPARKAVAKPEATPGEPQRALAIKVPGDTESIAGIPCRRVVAQMRAPLPRPQNPRAAPRKPLHVRCLHCQAIPRLSGDHSVYGLAGRQHVLSVANRWRVRRAGRPRSPER